MLTLEVIDLGIEVIGLTYIKVHSFFFKNIEVFHYSAIRSYIIFAHVFLFRMLLNNLGSYVASDFIGIRPKLCYCFSVSDHSLAHRSFAISLICAELVTISVGHSQ